MDFPGIKRTQRERQRDETRARLFDAALEEFREQGFDRASVARIAHRAGVSRPSFYFHYPTKEDVLLELQWRLEQRIVDRIRVSGTLREALEGLIEGMMEAEASLGPSSLYRDMLWIYVRRPDSLDLYDQPFPLLMEVGRVFAEGARRGELRDGLEPAQATQMFLTSVFGFLIATPGPPESRREDLRTLTGLYLDGSASGVVS